MPSSGRIYRKPCVSVTCVGELTKTERDSLEDLGVDGSFKLKYI